MKRLYQAISEIFFWRKWLNGSRYHCRFYKAGSYEYRKQAYEASYIAHENLHPESHLEIESELGT